jgi:hypothetical protein
VSGPTPTSAARVTAGQPARFRWSVQPPTGTLPDASALKTDVRYDQHGRSAHNGDERILRYLPPPPPAGTDAVSDLPFLSASNGWGPVERDMSNGEQAAGDGRPISIGGVSYAKGLGTNSPSDVAIYLGGTCSRFTADVGVDDETNGSGTVTFSVVGDGTSITSTPTIHGGDKPTSVSADVSGVKVLDLVVGDAGDGNGLDHADWGAPTLTCSS